VVSADEAVEIEPSGKGEVFGAGAFVETVGGEGGEPERQDGFEFRVASFGLGGRGLLIADC